MNKFERIQAAVAGEEVDRVPFSLWYHFESIPRAERAGKLLADAELDFYRKYDPDFLKVMHDIPFDTPEGRPVENLDEWKKLPVIVPDQGNFGRHLEAIRLILAEVGDEVPVVDTVFNCFAYAEKITGLRTMEFFRENPAAFHEGMSRVAESLARWAETAVKAGAAGIYLAVQGATADIMSEDEYRCEFLPYDRIVLQRIHDAAALNVVHIHSEDIHWRVWDALPFHALSWSSNITPPSIAEARQSYDGCIMAGVNEVAIGGYTPEQVIREIHEAIEATGGRGLIATCGCAVPTDCPPANLHAFKQAVTG